MFKAFKILRLTTATSAFALLVSLSPSVIAQETQAPRTRPGQAAAPATTATTQTDAAAKPATQVATAPAGEAVAAKAAEPLYKEYKGVTLGMSAADVRAKLGRPREKSDAMDFYVFNDHERARVYYTGGKVTAVTATYIGKEAEAPAPAKVLGTEIEPKADGSMYMMTPYEQAGYWVAYSRTGGDSPMVIVTMQKTP